MNPFEIFGGMQQPSSYYDKAAQEMKGAGRYFMPSFAAGTAQLPQYMHTLNQLTRHPTQLENQIDASYTMSPHAQYQTNLMTNQMSNQAAAGGQLGTPNEQIALANQTQGIVSKDQQQYYQDAMQPFQMGLSGEQYLTGLGMQGAQGIARQQTLAAGQQDLQASMAAKEKEAAMGMIGNIAGAGTSLAALAFL